MDQTGFSWIKRKHYFDAALNQRFIAGIYERGVGTHGAEKQETTTT